MVEMSDVITETSLISSAVIDTTSAYARDLTEEELHQMIDIPLEGGLLDVEVNKEGEFQSEGVEVGLLDVEVNRGAIFH